MEPVPRLLRRARFWPARPFLRRVGQIPRPWAPPAGCKSLIIQHESSELKHDIAVKDGDFIKFGNSELKVLHTPGHSQDSICLIGDGKIFSGDTLFVGNCGRIDLPGGSAKDLYHSIFDVLHNLDESLIMYSGHNYGNTETSTLGQEKITNHIMQKRTEQQFIDMMG